MHLFSRIAGVVGVAVMTLTATPVFAEAAPVFDVDSMQSFENEAGPTTNTQDVAPPASEQQQAFVPAQSNGSPAHSNQPTIASSASSSSGKNADPRLEQANENAARVESLQDEVQALRNQVDQLTHQLQQVQMQQKAGVKAPAPSTAATEEPVVTPPPVKTRPKFAAAKQSAKTIVASDTPAQQTTTAAATPAADGQPNVAEEQEIYQTAYNLIKAKKYNEAVDALQGMLKKYPSGQFASNAHYWLGELYGLMGKNDLALKEFDTVVNNYSDSPRVSDAQLKVGLIYSALAKWTDAKSTFKKVINHYPGTASARVASEQLKQIKTAGH